ncbi:MAG: leucine-rich repeat protein [Muribaculaceae bacterium]|nr:leucine-rich repeat protein [Muribaculaceae bacterium]
MKIFTNSRLWMMLSALLTIFSGYSATEMIESGGLNYKILSEESMQVAVAGVAEDATLITVPSSILIDSEEYTVTEIADQAFENCNLLQNIQLPSTLTAIRYMAFGHCGSLTEIAIPSKVTTIENWVFEACKSLKKVEFPPALTYLGYHAFDGCSALEEVTLPDSLEEIMSHAFYDCSSLKSVILPKNLKELGETCFLGCSSLNYIPLPSSLTEIHPTTFSQCSSLTDITIPASIKTIGIGAFDSCYALRNIYVLSPTPPLTYKSTFNRLDYKLINVYVEDEDSRYIFAISQGWNVFPDFIAMKKIEGKDYNLTAGETMELEATIPCYTEDVEWSSSDPEVASIDASGLLTANGKGSAKIYLTLTDTFGVKNVQEANVSVSVNSAIESIEADCNGNEQYFTLDGLKIKSQDIRSGFYIRVKNGKAERILR